MLKYTHVQRQEASDTGGSGFTQVELEVATDEPVAPLLVETDAQMDIQDPVDMEADDEVLQIGRAPW